MRRQSLPLVHRLEQVEDVIFTAREQMLLGNLFDLDVSAHGEINNRRGHVAGVNAIADHGAGFGGSHVFGRLVHRRH